MGDEGKVAHELGKGLVLLLGDFLLDFAQSHGLLDDLVVVGERSLVNLALEELGGVISAAAQMISAAHGQFACGNTHSSVLCE